MRELEVGSFCGSEGSGLAGGGRNTLAGACRGQKGGQAPWDIQGAREGLGRNKVTWRGLAIVTLELYESVLEMRGVVGADDRHCRRRRGIMLSRLGIDALLCC